MVALDPVSQEFTSDVSPYLAGIEEMIAATDRFRESVDAALHSVEELGLAFASLPDEKTIHVHLVNQNGTTLSPMWRRRS